MSTRWHLSYFGILLCLLVVAVVSGCSSRKVVTSSGDQRYVPGAKASPPAAPPPVKEARVTEQPVAPAPPPQPPVPHQKKGKTAVKYNVVEKTIAELGADMAAGIVTSEEITRAYLNRDLSALLALNEKYKLQDARVYNAMMDRLLVRRNANMAERMRVRLKEGNAFIAVGALHLPGETGMLRLLSAAGYHVTRVY